MTQNIAKLRGILRGVRCCDALSDEKSNTIFELRRIDHVCEIQYQYYALVGLYAK